MCIKLAGTQFNDIARSITVLAACWILLRTPIRINIKNCQTPHIRGHILCDAILSATYHKGEGDVWKLGSVGVKAENFSTRNIGPNVKRGELE